ncbi:phosphatase [Dentipellis sp. KUC8613]|nr:phosphatase [Dentipellis sp. KUC8613]
MPTTTLHFDAILFDMDGTLIDSTAGVVGAWELFRETYPWIDVDDILSSSHGVRTVENLQRHCKLDDPVELENEAERFEKAIVTTSHDKGRKGIVMLPGVREIMNDLSPRRKQPNQVWTICTSATRAYASLALETVGISLPDGVVFAEDVEKGKPQPDPYLLGAKRCGVKPENCLVVEDAPAGVRSGKAAGCKTLGLITSHSRQQMEECQPDFLIDNLSSVSVEATENGVNVTITVN